MRSAGEMLLFTNGLAIFGLRESGKHVFLRPGGGPGCPKCSVFACRRSPRIPKARVFACFWGLRCSGCRVFPAPFGFPGIRTPAIWPRTPVIWLRGRPGAPFSRPPAGRAARAPGARTPVIWPRTPVIWPRGRPGATSSRPPRKAGDQVFGKNSQNRYGNR